MLAPATSSIALMFKKLAAFLFSASALIFSAQVISAQETQTRVVDEVVAVVNDGVITLSRIKNEKKDAVDSLVQQGKSREEAQKLVDGREGELIANMINEELLIQKAKELGVDKDADQQVNERLTQIMKDNNIKTVDALYAEMEKQGVDPKNIKDDWRRQAIREMVLQREVQSKLYWGATGPELKAYFASHKDKFLKPETVSFSELFLGFAGRDEAQVRQKAKQFYDQLKAGADFAKMVGGNGDPAYVTQGAGKVEKVTVEGITDKKLAAALQGVKVGDYTLPVELDQVGIVILKIDAREAKSSDSVFDENAVRLAIVNEKGPEEQKKFLSKLRADAYIKVSESYRPLVSPLLFADERKTKPGTN